MVEEEVAMEEEAEVEEAAVKAVQIMGRHQDVVVIRITTSHIDQTYSGLAVVTVDAYNKHWIFHKLKTEYWLVYLKIIGLRGISSEKI